MHGENTLTIEVSRVLEDGFWLLIQNGEELFVSFDEFPWFRDVSAEKVMNVTCPQNEHLYWPDLDIDIDVKSIRHPELYPLVSRK